MSPERSTGTVTFGLPDREAAGPTRPPQPVATRSAASRARQRRRAAQRRSRAKMRHGSETLLVFLVLAGLTLLLIDLRTDGTAFAPARSAGVAVLGPLQGGIDAALDPAAADATLRAENERLQAALAAGAADDARLAELEDLLGVVSRSRSDVVAASVVAFGGFATESPTTATIDRGTAQGIEAGQAVLSAGGLAGIVQSAGPDAAVVLLASAPSFAVGGRLDAAGDAGIVRGAGVSGQLVMELLDPLVPVALGDPVSTFGSPDGGPFPPGVAIGTVSGLGDPTAPRRTLLLEAVAAPAPSTVAVLVADGLPDPSLQAGR